MGQSPPSSTYNHEEYGLPFYQGKADFGPIFPMPKKWCTSPKKIAIEDDILISVRAPVGPTNLCREKSCIGRGLAAIRARERANFKFLLYFLRSAEPEIAKLAQGSTFTAIGKEQLFSLKVPLPSLNEQRRIVAYLDGLQAKVEALRRLQAETQAELDAMTAAVLAKAFTGEL